MKQKLREYMRDNISACLVGVAIGDALGMPVETYPPEKIAALDMVQRMGGRVAGYIRPDGHRWFNGRDAGEWTDDYLFTSIIAESLITCGKPDLDDIAERQVAAYRKGLHRYGSGRATRNSLRRMDLGIPWRNAGEAGSAGNGVAMKVMPLAAYWVMQYVFTGKSSERDAVKKYVIPFTKQIRELAIMTHRSDMAIASGLAQIFTIICALLPGEDGNFWDYFLETVIDMCNYVEKDNPEPTLFSRMVELAEEKPYKHLEIEKLWLKYGKADTFVYNSLPFAYAMFLRGPQTIETLYDTVTAGGDTDTTGSIVGSLLGAYNGMGIFPQHLIDGLWRKDEIFDLANRFCDRFGL